jgi:hypothetical protein
MLKIFRIAVIMGMVIVYWTMFMFLDFLWREKLIN